MYSSFLRIPEFFWYLTSLLTTVFFFKSLFSKDCFCSLSALGSCVFCPLGNQTVARLYSPFIVINDLSVILHVNTGKYFPRFWHFTTWVAYGLRRLYLRIIMTTKLRHFDWYTLVLFFRFFPFVVVSPPLSTVSTVPLLPSHWTFLSRTTQFYAAWSTCLSLSSVESIW